MKLPKGATVAVADGQKLRLFRNTGEDAIKLTALPEPRIDDHNKSSGVQHHSSAANHNESRMEEDAFAAGAAAWLNTQALTNKIDHLVVVAAPKTLGELRQHFHKALEAKILGQISKDLTGHSVADIESALAKG